MWQYLLRITVEFVWSNNVWRYFSKVFELKTLSLHLPVVVGISALIRYQYDSYGVDEVILVYVDDNRKH